jgi:uncharacterized protein YggE
MAIAPVGRAFLPILAAIAVFAAPAASGASPRTITVHGTGTVKVTPTTADFTFGVAANAETASAALAANAALMNKVISALKGRGIAGADIQTAQISLQPNRNQAGDKILNYTATNTVTARVRSIGKAGPIVDAGVKAGSNEIGGPTFNVLDELAVSRKALMVAMADANLRAQAIAKAAGVKLGDVQTVSDQSTSEPVPIGALADAKAASTPVSPGRVEIQADVTVVYAIK